MQDREYIAVLCQSLEKKEQLLQLIIEKNMEQRIILLNEEEPPERLEDNLNEKGILIEELNKLDEGFEQIYARVKEVLATQKSLYKDEIKQMQGLIRLITDKSVSLQAQEIRNKELAEKRFSQVKKQVRNVRTSNRVASQYYKNMTNTGESAFLDSKK